MLWIKSFHLIALVAWFAGLFYLPRLFFYHCDANDRVSIERFKIMERRLYYAITWPAAVFTTLFGTALLLLNWSYYLASGWMHAKLGLVMLLWCYHLTCGHYVARFSQNNQVKNAVFFRFFNEIPTILLITIVILVVVKPF
jgi:putative membrane protein